MKKFIFEVETTYCSGAKRTDCIAANSESEMWSIYDKHHNKNKVQSSVIVDSWIQ